MTDSPTTRQISPWLTATTILLVMFGAYVGGYFLMGDYDENLMEFHDIAATLVCPDRGARVFPSTVFATAYQPMAWLESRARGRLVTLQVEEDRSGPQP
jgi:hypothetical protein